MRLASLQDPGGSDEWQLLLFDRLERLSRLTSDIDARLRRSERRDAVQKALRNRLAYGAPAEGLVEAHNRAYLDEVMSRQLEEAASEMRKTAEEAGLSPEAYMDDEIVEADDSDEPKEPQIAEIALKRDRQQSAAQVTDPTGELRSTVDDLRVSGHQDCALTCC